MQNTSGGFNPTAAVQHLLIYCLKKFLLLKNKNFLYLLLTYLQKPDFTTTVLNISCRFWGFKLF